MQRQLVVLALRLVLLAQRLVPTWPLLLVLLLAVSELVLVQRQYHCRRLPRRWTWMACKRHFVRWCLASCRRCRRATT
jgi:hypothetical protein